MNVSVDEFERLAALDRFGKHTLVSDPATADLILFLQCHMVDFRLQAVLSHEVARRHWAKVMVYNERDDPWSGLPGVYVSMPARRFDPETQRACAYIHHPDVSDATTEPDLLFSFVGSRTHPARVPLLCLRASDGVVEEVRNFMFWDRRSEDFENRRRRYRDVLARSKFVLCPRGRGTSTIRLYEALATGRVPVIISDDWVAPAGPVWEELSVRWPERTTTRLVDRLRELESDWPRMSASARAAYTEFFAPEMTFHRVIETCFELMELGLRQPGRVKVRVRAVKASLVSRFTAGTSERA